MPKRLNRILDLVSRNALRLKIDAIDETRAHQGPAEDRQPGRHGSHSRRADRRRRDRHADSDADPDPGLPGPRDGSLRGREAIGGMTLIGTILMTDRKERRR